MRRRTGFLIGAAAIVAIAVPALIDIPKTLIWNASASAPIGLYEVRPIRRLEVPDLVAIQAPDPLAAFVAERGYLPPGLPLLKRVVGLPGQIVCRIGRTITVDRVELGDALEHDRLGRPMPVWQGCRRIASGEVFLMNWDVRASLDGRYFGPFPTTTLLGAAIPLWTDDYGDGRYRWRSPTR